MPLTCLAMRPAAPPWGDRSPAAPTSA